MSFLDDSQTFVGTLASLITLCVLFNDNNFIQRILKNIASNIIGEAKKRISNINIDDIYNKGVKDTSNYSLLLGFIKKCSEKNEKEVKAEDKDKKPEEKNDCKLLAEALECEMKLNSTFNLIKSTNSIDLLKPTQSATDRIVNANEIIISPLYTLLVCLLLFVCDEVLRVCPQISSMIFSTLTIFITISFLYWFLLWRRYYVGAIRVWNANNVQKGRSETGRFLCETLNWFSSYVLVVLIFVNFVLISTSILIENSYVKFCVVHLLGMLMPILIIAILRLRSNKGVDEYKYRFVLKHFMCFLIVSISYACIIVLFNNALGLTLRFDFDGYDVIKYSTLFFIFINGMVLPFAMPYYGLKRISVLTKNKIESIPQSIDESVNDARKQLDNFIEQYNIKNRC